MIIISHWEARVLLSIVKKSIFVMLHHSAPRQTFSVSSLDDLMLYNVPVYTDVIGIPDNLRIQLNIFAGQLCLDSYADYQRIWF